VRDLTTFILAGGKSTRMGEEKAFLKLGKRLLIDHAILTARPLECDIFIVGSKEKFGAYGRTVNDIFPDAGPLGGIHAALNRSESPLNLVLAVDTPFIRSEYLFDLVNEARHNNAMVTVTKTTDGLQPLCAVYRKEFKDVAETALVAGKLKIDRLFSKGTVIFDSRRLGYDPKMFENLNTPEAYQGAVEAMTAPRAEVARR
jgi:molybdopterin-guanine dinucleotide biosynthesis protein A